MENTTKIYFNVAVMDLVLGVFYLCTMPFLAVHVYSDYARLNEEIKELKIGHAEIQSEIEVKNSEMLSNWRMKEYDHVASLEHMLDRYKRMTEEKNNEKEEFLRVIAIVTALILYGLLIIYFAYKLAKYTLKDENALSTLSTCTTSSFYWIVTNTASLGFVFGCWISNWNCFVKVMGYLETTGELFHYFFIVYLLIRVILLFIVAIFTLVCVSKYTERK